MASNGEINGNVNWDLAGNISGLFIIGINPALAERTDKKPRKCNKCNLPLNVHRMNKRTAEIIFG
jgi:hypothetical protein